MLSNEGRHEIYKHAKLNYISGGLCFLFNSALFDLHPELPWINKTLPGNHELCPFLNPESLPEFYIRYESNSWNFDDDQRLECLTACIEETKP